MNNAMCRTRRFGRFSIARVGRRRAATASPGNSSSCARATRYKIGDYYLKQMEQKREMDMAVSLGLASQYVSDANSPYMETMLKALLKIPEPLRIYHLVPIGYAKGNVAAPPRRELHELLHYETYDPGKFRSDDAMASFVKTRTLQGAYGRRGGAEGNEKD
jgi:hypothetical protein